MPDLGAAHELVTRRGATLLREADTHRVYADCVGHPFCLYPGDTSAVGRIERVVFDCFSPRALAAFYGELLDLSLRVVDEPERVEIARRDGEGQGQGLKLAFQHAAAQLAARLGAIRLPYQGGGFVYAIPAGHPFCLGE